MGMNVHQINANKGITLSLASGGNTTTQETPAALNMGFILDITGTVDIDLQVSNDGTNWYQSQSLNSKTADGAFFVRMPFLYYRFVETASAGGSATIYASW